MSTIYVLKKDGQQAVYDEDQVHDLLEHGFLTRENFFWREGMPDWRPLQELPPRMATAVPPQRRDDSSPELPARAQAAIQPWPSTAPSTRHSDDHDDLNYQFRFMHKVRFLRFLAELIDLLLVLAPVIVIACFGWLILSKDTGEARPNFVFFFCVGLYYIVLIIVQVVQTFWGRSVGKNFFGLRVVDIDTEVNRGFGANAIRLATHGFFGLIPFCLFVRMPYYVSDVAILYALIDALVIFYDDRCIHDYLAGTAVIQREFY
jgi:uncharacterized RDD family membrane protein YckC